MFGLSRQAYYQSKARYRARQEVLSQVKPLVLEIRREMPRIGTRKLYHLLKDDFNRLGVKIGRDGLFRYLRSESLLVAPRKNYTKTTNSKHWMTKYPNLMKDQLVKRPEEYFVSDITYVKSRERTHYLSLVTDAYSRKIMGYKLSDDMSAENVVKALQMAIKNRKSTKTLVHQSDRGLQYCSSIYQRELRRNGIKPSMTDGYDCYQNALAERVNGILKQEFLVHKCNTQKELQLLIDQSIETYNNKRPHLSLKMKTPNFIHEKTEEDVLFGSN